MPPRSAARVEAMAYARPTGLDEALRLMAARPWTVLAGGTDLYPATTAQTLGGDVLDIGGIDAAARHRARRRRTGASAAARPGPMSLRAELPPAFDALKLAAREVGSRADPERRHGRRQPLQRLARRRRRAGAAGAGRRGRARLPPPARARCRWPPSSTGPRRTAPPAGRARDRDPGPAASAAGPLGASSSSARGATWSSPSPWSPSVLAVDDGRVAAARVAVGACSAGGAAAAGARSARSSAARRSRRSRRPSRPPTSPPLAPIDDVARHGRLPARGRGRAGAPRARRLPSRGEPPHELRRPRARASTSTARRVALRRARRPAASPTRCARCSACPAPRSAATPATAAPAPCCSTASRSAPA